MHIRPYRQDDRAACFAIFDSNTPPYFAPSERTYLVNWLDAHDEGRHAYAENADERFYIAEVDGVIVGCGGYYVPVSERRGNMVWGMVKSEYHNQGIGRDLLHYRIDEIKQRYSGYVISLDTSQHTYQFFMKLGFIVCRVQKDAYGPGLDRYDMLLQPSDAPTV